MKTVLTLYSLLLCALFSVAQSNQFACLTNNDDDWHPVQVVAEQYRSIKQIPIVVHVIYKEDFFDISDNEVQLIINAANADFRRLNADTVDTPDAFKPVAADTKIEFVLASIDPEGNPTNGITHTKGLFDWGSTLFDTHVMKFDSLGGKSAWDTEHYANIWLVNDGGSGTGSGGLSTFPSSHGNAIDGIAIGYFQTLIKDRLTHSLGHYLGLKHVYGDGFNCSTQQGGVDGLDDTPNQFQSSASMSCQSFPTLDICSPDFPGIMFMNYMDDSYLDCVNLFTNQQADLMNYVIDSIRFSLLGTTSAATEAFDNPLNFKMYPNPVSDKINIELFKPLSGIREYRFYDSFGRLTMTKMVEGMGGKTDCLDISTLPHGLYWLQVKSGNTVFASKFIKA